MEVEEICQVDTGIKTQRVAQLVGIEVAKGAAAHQPSNGVVEHRLAQVTTQRVPHHPTFFVGGRAVGILVRHVVQRTVASVGDMRGAQHLLEVALIVVIASLAPMHGLPSHLAGERRAALINPHVARCGAGHEVAKPGMSQLVGDGALAKLLHGGQRLLGKTDVVHMLHRALVRRNISDATPAVGTETTLEHRHHRIQLGKYLPHLRAVGVEVAVGGGVGPVKRGNAVVDALPRCLAHRDEVGRRRLRDVPHRTLRAVGIRYAALQHAAAFGRPASLGLHVERVGGLVVEIVAAGHQHTAHHMGVGLEAHAEVIVHVAVEMEAAPAVALYVASSVVPHLDVEVLARGDTCCRQRLHIGTFHRHTIDLHRIHCADEVKPYCRAGTQQLHRHVGIRLERPAVTQIHRHVIILHIH